MELLVFGLLILMGVLVRVGKKKMPPGPFSWPVVGNMFLGGPHPHQVFAQLAKQYGNIMSLFFGSVPVVIVSVADMAKEHFSVSDAQFASQPIHDFIYTLSNNMNYGEENVSMAFSEYSPRVRELHRLCISELFTAQKLGMRKSTRVEEIQRSVEKLQELAMGARNALIEIRPVICEFTLRVSCPTLSNKEFLHSDRFSSTDSALHPQSFRRLEVENTKLLAENNIADVIPLFRLFEKFDVQGIHARWKDVNVLKEDCTSSVLEWYRDHAPSKSGAPAEESTVDFVETLMRLSESGTITRTVIKSVFLELLNASSDTMASTLEWAFLELVRHPHIMKRLQVEIDDAFGTLRPVEEDAAAQLPYLQAVVKEVLRLHTPATLGLPHCNVEDATLAGYHLPARTTVLANLWALHRDTTTWGDDALVFNPDKFLDFDWNVNKTNYKYLPFGAGRRICPGRALAMRVLATVIGSFVHAFEWSSVPGVELSANEGTDGLNIRPETPLAVRLSPRPAVALYCAPNKSEATPPA